MAATKAKRRGAQRAGKGLRKARIALLTLGAGVAVFAFGLWAGMQFGNPSGPSEADRSGMDRLVAEVAKEPSRATPQVPIPAAPPPVAADPGVVARTAPLPKYEEKLAPAVVQPRVPEPRAAVAPTPAPRAARPPAGATPAWIANAVPASHAAGQPMIAIVIDDVGVDRRRSEAVVALPAPLTLSYLTYADDLAGQTAAARRAGHELMVHVPMQPKNADADPGPRVLRVRDDAAALREKLAWGLSRFEGYVGVNNHMGSRFTAERGVMEVVMTELGARGLFFLDSVTSAESKGVEAADAMGVPALARSVFLDNEDSPEEVRFRLEQAEKVAQKAGYAIAIGHPHDATISVLRDWLVEARARGFAIVPVSAIVRQKYPKLWELASAGRP